MSNYRWNPRERGWFLDYPEPLSDAQHRLIARTNAGKAWTERLDAELLEMFRDMKDIHEIARRMGRTDYAIVCRLKKLGVIDEEEESITKPKKEKSMNYNHLISLLQRGYTTVDVQFRDPKKAGDAALYTYKVEKWIPLEPGDMVVVYAKGEPAIAWVAEVHKEPQIDVNASYSYGWIVSRVDELAYNSRVANEVEAVEMLKKSTRTAKQKKALDDFLETVPDKKELYRILGISED